MIFQNTSDFRSNMNDWIKKNYSNVLGEDTELLDTGDYDTLISRVRSKLKKF